MCALHCLFVALVAAALPLGLGSCIGYHAQSSQQEASVFHTKTGTSQPWHALRWPCIHTAAGASTFPTSTKACSPFSPTPRMFWGLRLVVSLPSTHPLLFRRSVPASNNKLLSTAAAYLTLGQQFTTVTRLYQTSGGLCLQAAGDATLSHDNLHALARSVAGQLKGTTQAIVVDGQFNAASVLVSSCIFISSPPATTKHHQAPPYQAPPLLLLQRCPHA
jgi:hypothetical protein